MAMPMPPALRGATRLGVLLTLMAVGRAHGQAVPILSSNVQFPFLQGVGSVGGRMTFSIVSSSGTTQDLWSSDGTIAGTRMIATTDAGHASRPCNGLVFFLADFSDATTFQTNLWRTDGTALGTFLLTDVRPGGAAPVPGELACVSGRLLFNRSSGLWASDGTMGGTGLMKPGVNGLGVGTAEAGGLVFFFQPEFGFSELWRTDGTPSGTFKLRNLNLFESGTADRAGDQVFVRACNAISCALSVEDGTVGGSRFVATVPAPFNTPQSQYALGRLFFVACSFGPPCALWVSDGTASGTHLLMQIGGDFQTAPEGFTEAFGRVFFSANDGVNGAELWSTDGSLAGTTMFADIAPGPASSNPGGFFFWRKRLFFAADDGTSGKEVWVTDGTAAGTMRFQDVNPGAGGSFPDPFVAAGDSLMFLAATSLGSGSLFSLPSSAAPVSGSGFVPLVPCRAVDTRRVGVPLRANSTGVFRLGGACGVPGTATAVSGNLTVTGQSAPGTLRVDSVTQETPAMAPLVFGTSSRANNLVVRLVGSPDVAIRCDMPSSASGSVHVVVDINGYYE
jgi:ELWxxDGT repeat protein